MRVACSEFLRPEVQRPDMCLVLSHARRAQVAHPLKNLSDGDGELRNAFLFLKKLATNQSDVGKGLLVASS